MQHLRILVKPHHSIHLPVNIKTKSRLHVNSTHFSNLHFGLFSYRRFLIRRDLRTGPAAGRQTYTCGMWREAPAYNNNTIHKTKPGQV